MATTLCLPRSVVTQVVAWAREGYPLETCGLLIGNQRGAEVAVSEAVPARNLETRCPRRRYYLDPAAFLEAERRAGRSGREIVGIWHSHPDRDARPSATDLHHAWAGWSYLIVAVSRAMDTDMRSWRLDDQPRFVEEVLIPEPGNTDSG